MLITKITSSKVVAKLKLWNISPLQVGIKTLILLGTYLHAFFITPNLVDDAFISFRYSANFADGYGLVFNSGERVEGFSNLSWTLLTAVFYKVGFDLPYVAWWAGVFFMLVTVLTTMQLAQSVTGKKEIGYLCGIGLATCVSFVGSSIRGLETSLFAATIVLSLLVLFSNARFLLVPILAVLAITRPEGMFLVLVILFFFIVRYHLEIKKPGKVRWTIALVIAFLGVVIFGRYLYYQELFPMTVIAKHDLGNLPLDVTLKGWEGGLKYFQNSLGWTVIVLALVSFLATIVAGYYFWRKRGLFYLTTSTIIGFCIVVTITNKGDWMPYARLLTPYYPVLLVLSTTVLYDLATILLTRQMRLTLVLPVVWTLFFAAFQTATPAIYFERNIFTDSIFNTPAMALGDTWRRSYKPGDIYVTGVLGRIGYYSRPVPIFDMRGLTEPVIAKQPIASSVFGKDAPDYIARLKPVLIYHNNWYTLELILAATQEKYLGVWSASLIERRMMIIVRAEVANRVGQPVIEVFGGELIDADEFVIKLKAKYPTGQ